MAARATGRLSDAVRSGSDPSPVSAALLALNSAEHRRAVEAGWPHVLVVGDDRRTSTVVQALTTGARGWLVAAAPAPAPLADHALSSRELQVLALAAEGLPNHRIGHELGLSALTVKSHLARMTRRLGARDRAHLVLLAMRSGALP